MRTGKSQTSGQNLKDSFRPDQESKTAANTRGYLKYLLEWSQDKLTLRVQKWSREHPWIVVISWVAVTLGLLFGALLARENSFMFQSENQAANGELLEGVVAHLSPTANSLIILAMLVIFMLTSFGTVAAALIGLGLAVTNLIIITSLLVLTRPPLSSEDIPAAIIIGLVGLGTSIDYSLFIVSRFRFKLRTSGNSHEALELAGASGGNANFASTIVWTIALSGLILVRDQTLTTIAIGTLGLIIIALLGSLTFIQALLALLETRINFAPLPYFGNDEKEGTGIWGRVVVFAARHHHGSAIAAIIFLGVLCLPLFQLRLAPLLSQSTLLNITGNITTEAEYLFNLVIIWAFVAGLTFVVVALMSRSFLLAVVTVLISLLSTGAALGVVVQVFDIGWFKELLGFKGQSSTIDRGLPLLLFPLFFGFSMSYQILTINRISEKLEKGSSTRVAVINGPRVVSGVVVSAGAITRTAITLMLVAQFAAIQQLGLGLVVSIYLDAVVVRCILVPAVLQLLSRKNWYLPVNQPAENR